LRLTYLVKVDPGSPASEDAGGVRGGTAVADK
jgi:hypothetical protein